MIEATSSSSKPFFSDEPFEKIVAILIALVTLIAAIAGYLQVDASARSKQALRDSQTYVIQAVGLKASGLAQTSAWTDILRLREELLSLAILADDSDQTAAAERYQLLADRVAALSPVFSPPYFDPAGDQVPDVAAFEADTYLVEATALSEQFINSFNIGQAWSRKENNYVTHLTLLAVSLFLYGLSLTVHSRMRSLFVSLGSLFTAFTAAWMLVVFLQPVAGLPEAAMTAYAQGVGWQYQDKPEQALAAFNEALAAAPDWP